MGKIIKREGIEDFKKSIEGKTLVATNGCFDILHIGHLRYLKAARALGDYLIVCLNSDGSVRAIKGDTRPINPEDERAELLCALECVDFVLIFEEENAVQVLSEIKPQIYVKGADWANKPLPEAKVIQKGGGRIEFIEFVDGHSTTKIIEKMNK